MYMQNEVLSMSLQKIENEALHISKEEQAQLTKVRCRAEELDNDSVSSDTSCRCYEKS